MTVHGATKAAGQSPLSDEGRPMTLQYDTRQDRQGWTVFDRWTGQVVVLDRARQSGLSRPEAERLAERLNARRRQGDRNILQ